MFYCSNEDDEKNNRNGTEDESTSAPVTKTPKLHPYSSDREQWFEQVFGFSESEIAYEGVRFRFRLEENRNVLVSTFPKASGDEIKIEERRFYVGPFEYPTVSSLRRRIDAKLKEVSLKNERRQLTFQHITGDSKALHEDPSNEGAVFQAASQFNCLEMSSPNISPEHGITRYIYDKTQGPACAMACPAGTVFRNYLVNDQGQGAEYGKQLDLLDEFGLVVGNRSIKNNNLDGKIWTMQNGYALPVSRSSVKKLDTKLRSGTHDLDELRSKIKVGIHWSTEVHNGKHRVCQVYSSALPVGYSNVENEDDFETFASLVLEATYEATLLTAAILSLDNNARTKVYLTKVGGGVFANKAEWICAGIRRALTLFENFALDVFLVHYGKPDPKYTRLLREMKS